jgi:hypothetical protein
MGLPEVQQAGGEMTIPMSRTVAVGAVAVGIGIAAGATRRHDIARRLRSALAEDGLRRTAGRLISKTLDYGFDAVYGTETTSWVDVDEIGVSGPNVTHAVGYIPTRAWEFRELMSKLNVPPNGTFVDFGSGKGRALLLASNYGFRRVIGVEFSAQLCEIARSNVAAYRRRKRDGAPIVLLEEDATEYKFYDDETVIYLYNPFDSVVLSAVLEGLVASIRRQPRQVWIVYNNPRWPEVVEKAGFAVAEQYAFASSLMIVYTNMLTKVSEVSRL